MKKRSGINLLLLLYLIGVIVSCNNSSINKSKETVDRFYYKLNTTDYDSLSTIFSNDFLRENDPGDAMDQIVSGRNMWGAFKKYEVTEFNYSTQQRCSITTKVYYENQTNIEKFILIPENDSMKIFYFIINP